MEHPLLEEANSLVERGQVGSAIDLLERAVALGDEDIELCKHIAKLCLSVNEVRAFTNWCHEAMRIDPHDGEPYLMVGQELVTKQRWGEAVEALEQALSMTTLTAEQRAEAGLLIQEARSHHAEWKAAHPGYSNL